jgi:hypothetical protein
MIIMSLNSQILQAPVFKGSHRNTVASKTHGSFHTSEGKLPGGETGHLGQNTAIGYPVSKNNNQCSI